MKTESLNKAVLSLIKKRQKLATLGYDNPDYDELEEALHEAEGIFQDGYGFELGKILKDIHEQYCTPETDVLDAVAYIPREYRVIRDEELDIEEAEVGDEDGILIDLIDFPNLEARLLLLPEPPRLVIFSSAGAQEVWWAE